MFERPCLPPRNCLRELAWPHMGLHSPSRADRYHFIRTNQERQRNSTSAKGECGRTSPLCPSLPVWLSLPSLSVCLSVCLTFSLSWTGLALDASLVGLPFCFPLLTHSHMMIPAIPDEKKTTMRIGQAATTPSRTWEWGGSHTTYTTPSNRGSD